MDPVKPRPKTRPRALERIDLVDLEQTVKLMRRLGVTRYCADGVEIELGQAQATPADAPPTKMEDLIGPEPTPEDLLAWSTSGPLPSEVKYEPPKE